MYTSSKTTSLTIDAIDTFTSKIIDNLLKFSKPFKVNSFGIIPTKEGIIVSINQDGELFVSHSCNMRKRLLQLPNEKNTKGIIYCMYAELTGQDDRLSARNAMKVQIKLQKYAKNNPTPVFQ